MHFKLLIAFVDDSLTKPVIRAARDAGATGATVASHARGEGSEVRKSFLGLNLEAQRDILLFVVEEHLARHVLEAISDSGEFEERPGAGIAFQIDIEDAVGLQHQIKKLSETVEGVL